MTVAVPEKGVIQGRVVPTEESRPGGRGYIPYQGPDERGTQVYPNSWVNRMLQKVPGANSPVNMQVSIPKPLPTFLGNRRIIVASWVAAMVLIAYDEWHSYGILPRPARLWYASLVYGGLTALSIVDPLTPIATALAIGYTLAVAYQIIPTPKGQNAKVPGQGTGTTQAPGTSTAGGRG